MKIDLSNEDLFNENVIEFDKKVNFVYGKNGTGKSTITNLLQKQYENNEKYDIRIFQGFDILIGKNENLNCITLSNENSKINKEIEKKESLILENQKKIEEINKKINNPLNNEKNLFSMKEERIAEFKKQKIYIDNALKRFASEIKGCSYKIHEGNKYDINDIKNDIKNMGNNCLLSEYEIDKFNNILKLEKKILMRYTKHL